MKFSDYLIPTLKEKPNDAFVPSHELMLRAGLIRKTGSGLYTYLPLGLKVLKKIENIIREEMEAFGGLEFYFPLLISKQLWDKTGRWEVFKGELFRLKDRHQNDFALGPTHEEAFTDFVKNEIVSYKSLPLLLYQIGIKFRDEIRPRFGVMRSKEFIMKDAYSFHLDEESLNETYEKMRICYEKIFNRCGLDIVRVAADSGSMGGSASEEYMVKSTVGEETILFCSKCEYAANLETAVEKIEKNADIKDFDKPQNEDSGAKNVSLKKVETPDVKTIKQLAEFLKIFPEQTIKAVIYDIVEDLSEKRVDGDGDKEKVIKKPNKETVMFLIRGDYQINEVKLSNEFPGKKIEMTSPEKVYQLTGAPIGFIGPIGLTEVSIFVDKTLQGIQDAVCGANEKDMHYTGVNIKNDFRTEREVEVYEAKEDGICVSCDNRLNMLKGIEVGHIFKLGKKYTSAFDVQILDENGKKKVPTMGCYGIGLTRTMASIIEQQHDKNGIIWPISVAPFHVHLMTLDPKDSQVMDYSEKIHATLIEKKIETLWDDRAERAGFKFKDADLLGIPLQVIIGSKNFSQGTVEIKKRSDDKKKICKVEDLIQEIVATISTMKNK